MDYYNIDIYQGDDFALGLDISDDDGNPMNLEGYGIRALIKNRYSSLSGVALNTVIDNAPSGIATLTLSSLETSQLDVGQAIYEVEVYPSDGVGTTFKILNGYASIFPEINT